jgi:hypothetical protein
MKNNNSILNQYPELILMEFCFDNLYDGLDVQDDEIVAYATEISQSYYGGMTEEHIIAKHWAYDEFDIYLTNWYNNYCEREDCLW